MPRRRKTTITSLLVLYGLAACAREAPSGEAEPTAAAAPAAVGTGAPAPEMKMKGIAAEDAAAARGFAGGGGGARDRTKKQAQSGAARPRMVHYDGYLKLKVTSVAETLQHASEIADAAGGYIERSSATGVTLRIPVARFRATFIAVAKIGDVLERSLTAADITDAYAAIGLRLETLRASRDRLIALLGKARKAREKLSLLREIKRLTEEIDQLDLQQTTLAALARFSRLSVEAVPHQVYVGSAAEEPVAAFRFIHDLSPFRRDVAFAADDLELAVPDGLVALSDSDHFVAESAGGTVFWGHRRANHPRGTTDFWRAAIEERLSHELDGATTTNVGAFALLRFAAGGGAGYRYLVGVHADDDDLEIVEVYYPSPEEEERFDAAVRAAIQGGAA